jgi:hypothetical protein
MISRKWLWLRPVMALAIIMPGAQVAQAEPLTPLTPGQVQYLDHARRVFAVSHDPTGFRSDGELLVDGRFACDERATGYVGSGATYVPAALIQLAFIYLCPS